MDVHQDYLDRVRGLIKQKSLFNPPNDNKNRIYTANMTNFLWAASFYSYPYEASNELLEALANKLPKNQSSSSRNSRKQKPRLEDEIARGIQDAGVTAVKQEVQVMPAFLVDIYIPELNLIIEYDGTPHDCCKQIITDQLKNRILQSNRFNVERAYYQDLDALLEDEIKHSLSR